MPKRYVARVRLPKQNNPRPPRRRKFRGVATKPDPSTRVLQRPDVTSAVFVDHSGRRGRTLRRVAFSLIGVVVVALALLWLSVGTAVFG